MIPRAKTPASSSASPRHDSEPLELPDPPAEASRYALDVLAQQANQILIAPDGQQESTLNRAAYRMGQLVGASAIGVEEVRRCLEAAAADMDNHDEHNPWQPGFIRWKVHRAILDGSRDPDPIQQLIQRGANQPMHVIVPPKPGDNPPFSDQGNAERFIRGWSDDVRHVPELAPNTVLGQWMVWTGAYWQADLTLKVQEMAKETVRLIALETPPVIDEKVDKDGEVTAVKNLTEEWAKKSESASRIRAMTSLAISDGAIEARGAEFDQNPYLLNVHNGTIDLYDQALRAAERDHYLTQMANVAFDPNAECPTWERFLLECMGGRAHMVDWLQLWCGYSLTGDTSEQKLVIHFGEGANGKSTFLDVFQHLLGTYAQAASPAAFMVSERERGDSPNPSLFALRGARVVQALETNDRQELNMAMVKAVTGGDKISVRNLHCAPIEFRPQFKLALATNTMPRISDQDLGAWRRLLATPWPVRFGQPGEPKINPGLKRELLLELPGILNWALAGCARWLEKGLQVPEEVVVATANYKKDSDDLGLFLEECLVIEPDRSIPMRELYDVYCTWEIKHPLGKKRFNEKLQRHGITKHKTDGTMVWRGITYSDEGHEILMRNQMGFNH